MTGGDAPADFIDARQRARRARPAGRAVGRARRSGLARGRRPPARPRRRCGGRPLDRPRRGGPRRAAARGEALDPRARRPDRPVRPGRRRSPGRALRLVAVTQRVERARDRRATRSGRTTRSGTSGRGSTSARRSTTSRGSSEAASGSGRTSSRRSARSTGKDLLHLQCHFGIDTLSWARLGARVTGADFSEAACRSLASDGGRDRHRRRPVRPVGPVRPARRPRGRLRHRLHVPRRARLAARHSALGGGRRPLRPARRPIFYITEIHPVGQRVRERGRRAG